MRRLSVNPQRRIDRNQTEPVCFRRQFVRYRKLYHISPHVAMTVSYSFVRGQRICKPKYTGWIGVPKPGYPYDGQLSFCLSADRYTGQEVALRLNNALT